MASTYHQLGMLARDRGYLDGAENWYRQSLQIKEALGDRPGTAATYAVLGMLSESRGDRETALDWNVRCVALFSEVPHPGPAQVRAI